MALAAKAILPIGFRPALDASESAPVNFVYSLSLTGMKDDPLLRRCYENSCNAITNTILDAGDQLRMTNGGAASEFASRPLWKSCGLFFPAHMTYPYLVSRPVR